MMMNISLPYWNWSRLALKIVVFAIPIAWDNYHTYIMNISNSKRKFGEISSILSAFHSIRFCLAQIEHFVMNHIVALNLRNVYY